MTKQKSSTQDALRPEVKKSGLSIIIYRGLFILALAIFLEACAPATSAFAFF